MHHARDGERQLRRFELLGSRPNSSLTTTPGTRKIAAIMVPRPRRGNTWCRPQYTEFRAVLKARLPRNSVTRVAYSYHVLHTRAHTWIELRNGRTVGTSPLLQMYVCSRDAWPQSSNETGRGASHLQALDGPVTGAARAGLPEVKTTVISIMQLPLQVHMLTC